MSDEAARTSGAPDALAKIFGESYNDRTIAFEDVTFHIDKMLAIEAKSLFMRHVRPLLRGALSANTEGSESETWQIVLAAFTDAPQEHYDAITRVLYRHITFDKQGQPSGKVLIREAELAFENLEMTHILLLDARAFLVNFSGSFSVLTREVPAIRKALGP